MDINHFRVKLPHPTDEFPRYTLVLQVGNGADVIAKIYPQDLDELVKKLVEAIESKKRRDSR